jgi:DhnA family fructose-bisphosphate aldolase class Ia
MIQEATSSIIQSGVVAVILTAGLIFMYKYFAKEVNRINAIIKINDDHIIAQNEKLNELMLRDIEISTKLNAALESLTKVIQDGH